MELDRRTVLLATVSALAAGPLLAQSPRRPLTPGKEVLAFYYGWYGTPQVSGQWKHWQGPTGKEAPDQDPRLDTPAIGLYDSHDPRLIARHADMLKRAGMTGIISSWWGQGTFPDQSLALLLDTMHARGLKVSAYVERKTTDGAASDLHYLVARYGAHPAWLKVDGRPVIFVYLGALRAVPGPIWRDAARQVAAAGLPEPVLIGDISGLDTNYAQLAAPFDGTHTYVMAPYLAGMNPDQMQAYTDATYPKWKAEAGLKIYTTTVDPAFDDHLAVGRKLPRPIFHRYGTRTFDTLWRAAIKTDPDWVLITTFNEWHEGAEIEPSTEYGDVFLARNAHWSRIFLGRG